MLAGLEAPIELHVLQAVPAAFVRTVELERFETLHQRIELLHSQLPAVRAEAWKSIVTSLLVLGPLIETGIAA